MVRGGRLGARPHPPSGTRARGGSKESGIAWRRGALPLFFSLLSLVVASGCFCVFSRCFFPAAASCLVSLARRLDPRVVFGSCPSLAMRAYRFSSAIVASSTPPMRSVCGVCRRSWCGSGAVPRSLVPSSSGPSWPLPLVSSCFLFCLFPAAASCLVSLARRLDPRVVFGSCSSLAMRAYRFSSAIVASSTPPMRSVCGVCRRSWCGSGAVPRSLVPSSSGPSWPLPLVSSCFLFCLFPAAPVLHGL